MKANRKFLAADDEAVSPVIAVILMVAITVVLAATVYVWVSGFSGSGEASASMALTRSTSGEMATLTVASVSPGLKWSDIKVLAAEITSYQIVTSSGDVSSSAALTPASSAMIAAGDRIYLVNGAASAVNAATLSIIDTQSNNVIATVPAMSLDAATANLAPTMTVARVGGTAADYIGATEKLRFTFNEPMSMSSLVIGDLSAGGTEVLGASLSVLSPTSFVLTFDGAGGTLDGTETITIAIGNVNDARGSATTSAASVALGGV